jgi:pathogenesis-related protein 1
MRAIRLLPVLLLTAGCTGIVESDSGRGDLGGGGPSTSGTGSTNGQGGGTSATTSSTGSTSSGSTSSSSSSGSGGGATTGSAGNTGASGAPGTGSGGGAGSGLDAGRGGAGGTSPDAGRGGQGGATPDSGSDRSAIVDAGRPETPVGDPEPGILAGITRAHNVVRAEVGVPGLTWDPSVAATAAAYAARCVFQHSGTAGLGENLAAYAPSGGHTGQDAVNSWAAEKANYDYASNTCAAGMVCGHYTQVVWKNSTNLGCGVQACNTNSPFAGFPNWEIWVCNYSPPGNFVGQRPY